MYNKSQNTVHGRQTVLHYLASTPHFWLLLQKKGLLLLALVRKQNFCCMGNYGTSHLFFLTCKNTEIFQGMELANYFNLEIHKWL